MPQQKSSNKLTGFLRLMRPANIVTAIADILAGIAISGYIANDNIGGINWAPALLLVLATVGLYGGGVVLNDVFDAELDRVERPERPIPSGLIRKSEAALLGVSLLVLGVVSAGWVHRQFFSLSFLLALGIAVAATVYDKWGKHHHFLGPINMGLCRGLNLLLGISILPAAVAHYWYLGLVPVLYIAAITMISRGEVYGGRRTTLYSALAMYLMVVAAQMYLAYQQMNALYASAFVATFVALIFPPLFRAIRCPEGKNIGRAVKAGVLALILMNAAWAAAFGALYLALFMVLLLPLSIVLAKAFAVT